MEAYGQIWRILKADIRLAWSFKFLQISLFELFQFNFTLYGNLCFPGNSA